MWAYARHYIANDRVVYPWEGNDWHYCKVRFRKNLRNATNAAFAILAHEAGHCMGLAHTTEPAAIMHKSIASQYTRRANAHELRGINHLYAR